MCYNKLIRERCVHILINYDQPTCFNTCFNSYNINLNFFLTLCDNIIIMLYVIMICVKLIYILLYNSFTGHLYLYAPLLYIIYLLMTKSLTFTLLLLNVLLFLFSVLKYFLIICLILQFARVASLLTQCLTINVLHMLLSLFLLLQIMLFNYPLSFYL